MNVQPDAKNTHMQMQMPEQQPAPQAVAIAGPSFTEDPNPTVYRYFNPTTQEHVTSLLPPDHPEMVCLQAGRHIAKTQFGILGKLEQTAVGPGAAATLS